MKKQIAFLTALVLVFSTAACSTAPASTAPASQTSAASTVKQSSKSKLSYESSTYSSYSSKPSYESSTYSSYSSKPSYESSTYSSYNSKPSYESSTYSSYSSKPSYESSTYSSYSSKPSYESSNTSKADTITLLGETGTFTGTKKNGMPVQGTFKSKNITYTGSFKNGVRSGSGETTTVSGNKILFESGTYYNNKISGQGYGMEIDNSGNKPIITKYYKGNFSNGQLNDDDTIFISYLSNGNGYYVFEGPYKNNNPSGTLKYTLYDKNGKDIECGKYINGEFKKSNIIVRIGHLLKNAAISTVKYMLSDEFQNELTSYILKSTDEYLQNKVSVKLSAIGKKITSFLD